MRVIVGLDPPLAVAVHKRVLYLLLLDDPIRPCYGGGVSRNDRHRFEDAKALPRSA